MNSNEFRSLGLSNALLKAISEMGFSEMTPIQAATIPAQLSGQDIIGQSKTGSGKTAAFVIPILHQIKISNRQPQALILGPTRELFDQVLRECQKFSKYLPGFKIAALIGGKPYPEQESSLKSGAHLIVGTPGRTLEHFKNGKINFSQLRILVLDEADRLLEEGFTEEMTAIIEKLPKQRQTVFFSATFPPSIKELSQAHQKNAKHISTEERDLKSSNIQQFLYLAEKPEKIATLVHVLENHPFQCALIFCRTKALVAEIGSHLQSLKMSCQVLHADLKQKDRDLASSQFRSGKIKILVATDVAARGLDIDILDLVINVDLPSSVDIYTHRIGRTGRAGRKGKAVSIATDYEAGLVLEIEVATGVSLIRPT